MFLKKRDPRFLNSASSDPLKARALEAQRLKADLSKASRDAAVRRAQQAAEYRAPEYAQAAEPVHALDSDGDLTDSDDDDADEIRCEACDKAFRTIGAWENHERSRKHLQAVKRCVAYWRRRADKTGYDASCWPMTRSSVSTALSLRGPTRRRCPRRPRRSRPSPTFQLSLRRARSRRLRMSTMPMRWRGLRSARRPSERPSVAPVPPRSTDCRRRQSLGLQQRATLRRPRPRRRRRISAERRRRPRRPAACRRRWCARHTAARLTVAGVQRLQARVSIADQAIRPRSRLGPRSRGRLHPRRRSGAVAESRQAQARQGEEVTRRRPCPNILHASCTSSIHHCVLCPPTRGLYGCLRA